MALIIKCICGKRLKGDSPCPACGSAERKYTVDYRPDGRYGRRERKHLPESTEYEEAKIVDVEIRASLKGKKAKIIHTDLYTTVDRLFPDYLIWCERNRQPATKKDIGMSYENTLKDVFGKLPVQDITSDHYDLYQRRRGIAKITNRTINKELDYFSGFLKWCRQVRKMPLDRISYVKLPYERPLPIVLSPAEALAMLKAAEPFYRAFFLCLYGLGLRFNEAKLLKWDDIDVANMTVRVVQKGGGQKILPMQKIVYDGLKKIGSPSPGKYIFVSTRTGEPIVDVRKAIDRAKKKAGIQKKVTPHLFRHSMATAMMSDEVNIRKVQQMLGHAQLATTQFYTHVAIEHLRSASDGLFRRKSTRKAGRR